MKRHFNKIPSNDTTAAAEILVLRSLLIIKELLTHHQLIMIVIAEIGPTVHLITSVSHQVFYIKVILSTTNKPNKNTLEYMRLLLKTIIRTVREILDTKNMSVVQNYPNISGT